MAVNYTNDIDIFDEELDSALVSGGGGSYLRPTWMSGVQLIHKDAPKGTGDPRGWYYPASRMDDKATKAFEKLVSEKKALLLNVVHDAGKATQAVKQYYRFTGPEIYYILSHGVPAKSAILRSVESRVGIDMGSWANPDFKKSTVTQGSYLSVLAVSKSLYEAGYYNVEEDGDGNEHNVPLPVNLYMKGQFSKEMLTALSEHMAFLKKMDGFLKKEREAGDKEGLAKKWLPRLQFWSVGLPLDVGDDKVTHTGKDSQNVFSVEAVLPDRAEWNLELLSSLYCGDALFKEMHPFVWDGWGKARVMGGVAVEWCREGVEKALANQQEWTDPQGKPLPYGTQDIPAWYNIRKEQQNVSGSSVLDAPANTKLGVEELKREINKHLKYATRMKNTDLIELAENALGALSEEAGVDIETASTLLEELAEKSDNPF